MRCSGGLRQPPAAQALVPLPTSALTGGRLGLLTTAGGAKASLPVKPPKANTLAGLSELKGLYKVRAAPAAARCRGFPGSCTGGCRGKG